MKDNLKKQRRMTASHKAEQRVSQFLQQARNTIDQQTKRPESFDYEAAVRQLSRTQSLRPTARPNSPPLAARKTRHRPAFSPRLPLRLAATLRRPQLAMAAIAAVLLVTVLLFSLPSSGSGNLPLTVAAQSLFAPIDEALRFSASALTNSPSYEFELALAAFY